MVLGLGAAGVSWVFEIACRSFFGGEMGRFFHDLRTAGLPFKALYNVNETTKIIGKSDNAIRCAYRKGKIRPEHTGSGVMIPATEIARFWYGEKVELGALRSA